MLEEPKPLSRPEVRNRLYTPQAEVIEFMGSTLVDFAKKSVGQHPGFGNVPRAVSQEAFLPLTCFPVVITTWETFTETCIFLQYALRARFGCDPLVRPALDLLKRVQLVNEGLFVPCSADLAWVETPMVFCKDAPAIASPLAPFFAVLQHPAWFRQTSLVGERGLFPGLVCKGLMLPDGLTPILAAHTGPLIKRPITSEARVFLDQGLPYATALRPAFMGRTLPPPPPSLTGSSVR